MIPVRLQIENFCTHGSSDISFDGFSSALIIGKIKGNDKFSNGVGKSTIFSAIKYVLFNEIDYSTLDKIIRHGEEYCKVSFDFRSVFDGNVYRIVRSKSKKTGSDLRIFKIIQNNLEDITQRRNQDTEKEVAKLIGINYKTFCNSVLFAQSDLLGLASLTPEKRKLALKEALQLNIYSKYESVAKKKSSEIIKEIEREKIIIQTLGSPSNDIDKFEIELKEIINLISFEEKNQSDNLIKLNDSLDNRLEITKKCEDFDRQMLQSVEKQKSLQNDIVKIYDTISDYRNKITTIEKLGKSLSKDIEGITSSIEGLQSSKIKDKSSVKNDMDLINIKIMEKTLLYNEYNRNLIKLRVPFPEGSACDHCRRKLDFNTQEDRDMFQTSISLEVDKEEARAKLVRNDINDLSVKYKLLKNELFLIEKSEELIINKKLDLSNKNNDLITKRSLFSEYASLLEDNLKLLKIKNEELELVKTNQSSKNIDDYTKSKIDLINCNKDIERYQSVLDDSIKSINILSNKKAVIFHKIDERKNDLAKINVCVSNISNFEHMHSVHQKVVQAFGSAGIPALIIHTILDDFQLASNEWLSRLRPGLQLQFSIIKDRSDGDKDDTLDINYIINGFNLEYAQLSGAQKFIAALSLKLGLASVIKKRLGVEIGMLLIDEVDQSLDEGGLEAFEEVITQLQKDYKVIVITHNNNLKEKFNHAILVEQDERFVSTAKVVNIW